MEKVKRVDKNSVLSEDDPQSVLKRYRISSFGAENQVKAGVKPMCVILEDNNSLV